jgi:hypothetical protein
MTFAEQLKEQFKALIPEDKQGEFEANSADLFKAMDGTFAKYDNDTKSLKRKIEEAQRQQSSNNGGASIDPRELDELRAKLSERESAFDEINSKYSEVTGKYSKAEKEAKTYQAKLEAESSAYSELVKQSELRKAIGLLSLVEDTGEEVFALLSSNVKVKIDDKGGRKAVATVPDADGKMIEKPLDAYVKDWAATSSVAKRVLAAPRNSGSGAQGSQGTVGGPATLEQKYMDAQKRGDVASMMLLKAKMASGAE